MNATYLEPPAGLTAGLFHIRTSHDTLLQCSPDGQVEHSAHAPDTSELVLYVPETAPFLGFLMTRDGNVRFRVDPDASALVAPLRVLRDRSAVSIGLCHPYTGDYLCAVMLGIGEASAAVVINRQDFGEWETFYLEATEAPEQGTALAANLAALEAWAALPLTGPQVLHTLERGGIEPAQAGVFDAFARQLPRDQIEWLGPTILGRPTALASLAAIFPGDVFAATAFPDLHAWLATRPRAGLLHVPTELDDLAVIGLDGVYSSFSHMATTAARRCIPMQRQICVLATARNEGLYLLEWIAHHRSIGVEGFFLYSNDNTDGSDTLLAALAQAGVITWINSDLAAGRAAQPKAYGHALGMLPNILDYRWTLIIDLDEFLVLDAARFASVGEYIDWQEVRPVDAIALNWLVYGSCGENAWRRAPLGARFTRRLPWMDPHVKTIVRTSQAMHSRPHHPVSDIHHPLLTRNASGAVHIAKDSPSFSAAPEAHTAWINHYFLKSADEFLWKFSRNRGDYALVRETTPSAIDPTFLEMFASQHHSANVTPDDRILAFSTRMAAELAGLMSLPGVPAAMGFVEERYREGVGRLKSMIQASPAFQASGTPHARFASLLIP
jgi:hypothetical protein